MTLAEALDRARALDAAAAAGWKNGYDAVAVRAEATACLRVFEREATTAEKAREIVEALSVPELAW